MNDVDPVLVRAISGKCSYAVWDGHKFVENGLKHPVVIIPGSFNPLHEGHTKLAAHASKLTGMNPVFELSVTNYDKPALDHIEVMNRVSQFIDNGLTVAVTTSPLMSEKVNIFPRDTVVAVGIDTFQRLLDERDDHFQSTLYHLMGSTFVVFPRKRDGQIVTVESLRPSHGQRLNRLAMQTKIMAVNPNDFLIDVSSTEIRQAAKKAVNA